jgi:hypothetical protein
VIHPQSVEVSSFLALPPMEDPCQERGAQEHLPDLDLAAFHCPPQQARGLASSTLCQAVPLVVHILFILSPSLSVSGFHRYDNFPPGLPFSKIPERFRNFT